MGRRFAHVYFTQSAARREVEESSPDSAKNPPKSAPDIPNPDPFQYDGAVALPDLMPITVQQLERHQQLFVFIAESAATVAQRRLQFIPPILLTVPPNPQRMAIAPNQITNLKVKFETFKGAKGEDLDCHIGQFQTK